MIRKIALLAGAAWLAKKYLIPQAGDARADHDGAHDSRTRHSDLRQFDPPPAGAPYAPTDAGAPTTGHVPTDLLTDEHPDGSIRAEDHYRPDPTAAIPPEHRESLRPVTAPAPHDPPGR